MKAIGMGTLIISYILYKLDVINIGAVFVVMAVLGVLAFLFNWK